MLKKFVLVATVLLLPALSVASAGSLAAQKSGTVTTNRAGGSQDFGQ